LVTAETRVRRAVSSLEAAALAGLGAATALTLSVYLLGRQPGVRSSSGDLAWYADSSNRFTVFVGLNLAPVGIIAFFWFMAVIRRRLGDREDQLFSTAFLGSGTAFGLAAGALLGLTGAFAGPLDFLFPAWLVVVSVTVLVTRRTSRERREGDA
jgi:hypothetical protein